MLMSPDDSTYTAVRHVPMSTCLCNSGWTPMCRRSRSYIARDSNDWHELFVYHIIYNLIPNP